MAPGPVTAADLDLAVATALEVLRPAVDRDWRVPAPDLDWDCWEILEHLADDLFAYAAQLAPTPQPQTTHVPFVCEPRRLGGPAATIFADPQAGPAGLLQVVQSCGVFLSAVVRTVPPQTRAYHIFGLADPIGFAAMGVVETLVHLYDVAGGLDLAWQPPADLCERVLARLFPHAPAGFAPWPTVLWGTGRVALPGHDRLTRWRWYADVPD